jgi:diphthamide synthase subunit DPH2
MISSITNRGKVRFMPYRETMTSQVLIKFMSRLIKDTERKVFLILDNLRVHHSKDVKSWLEENQQMGQACKIATLTAFFEVRPKGEIGFLMNSGTVLDLRRENKPLQTYFFLHVIPSS